MLSKKIEAALNKQMMAEFYSEYLYLAMAAWFESQSLFGFANWMKVQAAEEHGHGLKFFDHLCERRGHAVVGAIDKPPADWKSPLAVFEDTLEHEQKVTAAIHAIVDAAGAEKDHATANFLQWFVHEQVDEEANPDAIVQKLRMAGESKGALLYVDHDLGKRKE